MGVKVASRRDSRLAMRDLEGNKVNDLNSRSGVLTALWLDSEGADWCVGKLDTLPFQRTDVCLPAKTEKVSSSSFRALSHILVSGA